MIELFVDNLTVIDFSYLDSRRGILGESWTVNLSLSGHLDEQGMVLDFGSVKKQIKALIDRELDHRFIIPTAKLKPECTTLDDGSLQIGWKTRHGTYVHRSPVDAVVLFDAGSVTEDNLARHLEQLIRQILPANVSNVSVSLQQEDIKGAWYHYSHGLKKHDGNCQRIVHGHRSRIEIHENHKRNTQLEDLWAARFRDIYIGTKSDISRRFDVDGKAHIEFAYTASQGTFLLSLPASQVYLIDTDSTVELIAEHIAIKCLKEHSDNHFRVRAFEGINKGAVAIRQP